MDRCSIGERLGGAILSLESVKKNDEKSEKEC